MEHGQLNSETFPQSKIIFYGAGFFFFRPTFGKSKTIRDIKIIPVLPAADFEVEQDQIHWTEATANKLYHSRMKYLSLN